MGTDGFEFVEYAAPDPQRCARCSSGWAFPSVARHRSKNVTLYRQGDINFIVNAEADSFAQAFARAHGPSSCAMAFRVKDAGVAYRRALEQGARPGPTTRRADGAQHPVHQGHRRLADLSRRPLRRAARSTTSTSCPSAPRDARRGAGLPASII